MIHIPVSFSVSASINAVCVFVLMGTVSAASLLGKPESGISDVTTVIKGRALLSVSTDAPKWEVSCFL